MEREFIERRDKWMWILSRLSVWDDKMSFFTLVSWMGRVKGKFLSLDVYSIYTYIYIYIYIYSFYFFFFLPWGRLWPVFKDSIESSRLICRKIDRQIIDFTNAYLTFAGYMGTLWVFLRKLSCLGNLENVHVDLDKLDSLI